MNTPNHAVRWNFSFTFSFCFCITSLAFKYWAHGKCRFRTECSACLNKFKLLVFFFSDFLVNTSKVPVKCAQTTINIIHLELFIEEHEWLLNRNMFTLNLISSTSKILANLGRPYVCIECKVRSHAWLKWGHLMRCPVQTECKAFFKLRHLSTTSYWGRR